MTDQTLQELLSSAPLGLQNAASAAKKFADVAETGADRDLAMVANASSHPIYRLARAFDRTGAPRI